MHMQSLLLEAHTHAHGFLALPNAKTNSVTRSMSLFHTGLILSTGMQGLGMWGLG